jgi:hemerythrin-like metal-binding protein
MAFIDAKEYENVNINAIDVQQLRIIKIVNTLYDILGFEADNTVKLLTKQLAKVLRTSFETEEKYMRQVNFVNYISHKLEHERYLKKIQEFAEDVDKGNAKVDVKFMRSFKTWFFNHQKFKNSKLQEISK